MSMRKIRWALTGLVGAALLVPGTTLAQGASGEPTGFTVIAPDQSPLGISYPEWVGRWNQWFLGLPAEGHPWSTDDCQAGQADDVLIIPATFFGNTLVTSCTSRADQPILVSPASTSCAREPGDPDEALVACAQDARPTVLNVGVTVDGEPLSTIDDHWFVSAITPIELPEDNLFGIAAGPTDIVAGGWFAMLEPLAPGTHEIVLHAETDYPDDEEGPLTAETIATVEVVPVDAPASAEPAE
jgi:hypothetical protein